MKVNLGLAAVALIACIGVASAAPPPTVAPAAIAAENALWTSLGATLPRGGVVLAQPYAAPYSNRSFVVPYAWYRAFYDTLKMRHDYPVNAAALRADLPTLHFLMQKTYAGYATAQERGWNWDAWFAGWDRALAARGNATLSLREAFAPWGRLETAQPDSLSGVAGWQAFANGSISAVLAQRPSGPCTTLRTTLGTIALSANDAGQQPHAVQAWNGASFSKAWYVAYPSRDGSAHSISCADRSIAVQAVSVSPKLAQVPSYALLAGDVAYVRLPTFDDANNAALYAALTKVQGLGSERIVLFDLRGNDGSSAPTDILSDWVAQSQIEQSGGASQYGTTSCFHTALAFGAQQQLVGGIRPPASAQVTQFVQQVVDTLKGQPDCSVQPDLTQSDTGLQNHRFTATSDQPGQPRLVAIVDNGCGGDCEYMADLIAGLPGSVVVGSSTAGVMGFSQPGYFVLPHSRVPFRLALTRTDPYGDGRSVEGRGISVDVLLATTKSQSQVSLLALARRL